MTRLELREVKDAGMGPLSLPFDTGLWVMLGDSLEALGRLLEIAAGVRRARKGRALLGGSDVFESANARRKIASLLPIEALLPTSRVSESLALAAQLRGAALDGADLLERCGLARFANSSPEGLGPVELRAVALASALALEATEALLLHDPFSLHALVPKELVIAHCRVLSERASVLITTTRLEDALALGGATCRLERGRLLPHVGLVSGEAHGSGLVVRTAEARRLALLLADHSAIRVLFDEQRSLRELRVFGAELPALARTLCEVARAEQIALEALTPIVPPRAAGAP